MRNKSSIALLTHALIALGLAISSQTVNCIAADDDGPPLELHEWSVWLGEPQSKSLNASADYPTTMPGLVDSERSRRRETDKKPKPSPIGMITLYGTPPEVCDVDLKITAGRPISQWPRSEGKAARLRWLDLTLSKELSNPELIAYIPETHWFHKARELGGLYIQLKKGGRAERFFAYDLELQTNLNIRLDGGPEQYKFANLGKHKLHDVLLIIPDKDGARVGWLDTIAGTPGGAAAGGANPGATPNNPGQPAAGAAVAGGIVLNNPGGAVIVAGAPANAVVANAPANAANPGANAQPASAAAAGQPDKKESIADIPLSGPLAADSEEFKAKTDGELRKRLAAAGLNAGEIDLMLSLYAPHFFATDEIQLVYRVSPEGIDEITPLTVEPDTTKIKRVSMVIARKVDPRLREDVQKLIVELGDVSYSKREAAEKRLKELGTLATAGLKEAMKNKDLEVVMRAERLLLRQKEQLGAEPNPQQ